MFVGHAREDNSERTGKSEPSPFDGGRLDRGAAVDAKSPLPLSFPVEGKDKDNSGSVDAVKIPINGAMDNLAKRR